MVVQHNLRAMNSNRMLGITSKVLGKSAEKLSSGYKVNRAADDAAGLSISEKMRKQIRGLTQATANAEDGISAVQTAEGALTEVHDMLQRMNELANKASNGTNSESDRQAIQDEIDQLTTEIDRVAETTKFNEMYLLKGDTGKMDITLKAHDAGLKGTLETEGDAATFTAAELNDGDSVMIGGKTFKIGTAGNGVTAASAVAKDIANAMKTGKKGDTITIGGTKYTADDKAGTQAEINVEKGLAAVIEDLTAVANGAKIDITDSDGNTKTYTYAKVQTGENALNLLAAAESKIATGDSIKIGDIEYKAVMTGDITDVKTTSAAKAAFFKAANFTTGNKVTLDGVEWTFAYQKGTAADTGVGSWYTDGNGNFKEAKTMVLKEGDFYTLTNGSGTNFRVSDKIDSGTGQGFYDKDGNKFKVPDTIADGTMVAINVAAATNQKGIHTVGSGEKEGFFDATGKMLVAAEVADLVTAGTKVTFTDADAGFDALSGVANTATGETTFDTTTGVATASTLEWKDSATTPNLLTKDIFSNLADGTTVSISSTKKDYTVGKPGDTITKETAYENMATELAKANSIGTTDPINVTDNKDGTFSFTLGKVNVAKTLDFNLHVGADADMTNKINVKIDTMNSAFLGIKDIDVVGRDENGKTINDGGIAATYAIDAISDAIAKVSAQRSLLGAVQNRLDHTINNLENVVENTTAAESQIRDTDMATEMVKFANSNILAQAGQSMLAQANQANQGVLSLLG